MQAKSSCYGGVRISQQVPVRAFRARLYGEMVPRKCIVRQVRRSLSLSQEPLAQSGSTKRNVLDTCSYRQNSRQATALNELGCLKSLVDRGRSACILVVANKTSSTPTPTLRRATIRLYAHRGPTTSSANGHLPTSLPVHRGVILQKIVCRYIRAQNRLAEVQRETVSTV